MVYSAASMDRRNEEGSDKEETVKAREQSPAGSGSPVRGLLGLSGVHPPRQWPTERVFDPPEGLRLSTNTVISPATPLRVPFVTPMYDWWNQAFQYSPQHSFHPQWLSSPAYSQPTPAHVVPSGSTAYSLYDEVGVARSYTSGQTYPWPVTNEYLRQPWDHVAREEVQLTPTPVSDRAANHWPVTTTQLEGCSGLRGGRSDISSSESPGKGVRKTPTRQPSQSAARSGTALGTPTRPRMSQQKRSRSTSPPAASHGVALPESTARRKKARYTRATGGVDGSTWSSSMIGNAVGEPLVVAEPLLTPAPPERAVSEGQAQLVDALANDAQSMDTAIDDEAVHVNVSLDSSVPVMDTSMESSDHPVHINQSPAPVEDRPDLESTNPVEMPEPQDNATDSRMMRNLQDDAAANLLPGSPEVVRERSLSYFSMDCGSDPEPVEELLFASQERSSSPEGSALTVVGGNSVHDFPRPAITVSEPHMQSDVVAIPEELGERDHVNDTLGGIYAAASHNEAHDSHDIRIPAVTDASPPDAPAALILEEACDDPVRPWILFD
ncbi:hypothetical protein NUW54_g3036 [Trametes sanguinea]|uniref:Uncharacterized protein n=1 Tax=Trametes sanguinea TaxID=158606 RepID=A0ACC1Q344_9APHY|nr:hypothetical protein NUW54_g3036 [Trametes sanguinea]